MVGHAAESDRRAQVGMRCVGACPWYGLAMLDAVAALACLFLHVVATLFPTPTRLGPHDLPDTRSRHVVRALCYSATDSVHG